MVAAGWGNENLYQVLVDIMRTSYPWVGGGVGGGIVTLDFVRDLQTFCPAGSPVFTNTLASFVGKSVAIDYDCTVQTVSYKSSSFAGQSGAATQAGGISGVGSMSWIYATNLANPLASWTTTSGGVTTPYHATALGFVPGQAAAVPAMSAYAVWLLGCGLGVAAVYLMRRRKWGVG